MAKELVGMVRQAIHGDMYNGLKISNRVEYSLLQFADDTILIRKVLLQI